MSSLFFDHLININQLQSRIDQLEITELELHQLHRQIDELIQHRVVEVILDRLHQDHHHTFISNLQQNPADTEILVWLNQYIQDVESQIQKAIQELEQELIQEIFVSRE